MRTNLASLIIVLLLTACLPTPASIDSGIYGQITIGPSCPVVEVNHPCPDKPYQATLDVFTQSNHTQVLQFQTDSTGYFREALAPGEYIMHPESPHVMPHARDENITVRSHEYAQVTISYDSGIR